MDDQQAVGLWTSWKGRAPRTLRRYTTGLCHAVFEVDDEDGRFVLRVAQEGNRSLLVACRGWLSAVANLGLPVPRIVHDGAEQTPPFLVLGWLEGEDLGTVYDRLTSEERRAIASAVASLTERLQALGPGRGYGFLSSPDDQNAHPSWVAVLRAHLQRSGERIRANGKHDASLVDRAFERLAALEPVLARVEPLPFFDDATTKNVLVHQGRFAGLVDLDWLGYGDRLLAVALTRVSLLSAGRDPDYIEAWLERWPLDADQRLRFEFYTLCFALDFLGEDGTRFNRDEPVTVAPAAVARLLGAIHHRLQGS